MRFMRAQIKGAAKLATMTASELSSEKRRLNGLVEARRRTIDELRDQIGRLSDGYAIACEELRKRGS